MESNLNSQLPPPQPPDKAGTRPPPDLTLADYRARDWKVVTVK